MSLKSLYTLSLPAAWSLAHTAKPGAPATALRVPTNRPYLPKTVATTHSVSIKRHH